MRNSILSSTFIVTWEQRNNLVAQCQELLIHVILAKNPQEYPSFSILGLKRGRNFLIFLKIPNRLLIFKNQAIKTNGKDRQDRQMVGILLKQGTSFLSWGFVFQHPLRLPFFNLTLKVGVGRLQ